MDRIKKKVLEYYERIVQVRRYLHQHPELSMQEFHTANHLCEILDDIAGISYRKGVAGTGIVGFLDGRNPEKQCVAIRCEMDALPITENLQHSFTSLNNGVMHACGHDLHMAVQIGVLQILSDLRNEFEGRVMFIFQPSEEEHPGGAYLMLQENIFNECRPFAIFALHATPEMDAGMVGMKTGKYMASTDELYITVKGKGGHGATPHLNTDPIVISAHLIVALQTLVSRNANPSLPTTLSFGKIAGMGKTNIIPNEVKLEGILRTFDEDWRETSLQRITDISQGVTRALGGSCDIYIDRGYPCLNNHKTLTQHAFAWSTEYLGTPYTHWLSARMTADDFAYFAQQIPGCYIRVGTGKKDSPITNLHTDTFDLEEESIKTAMGIMAWNVWQSLQYGENEVINNKN